MHTSQCHWMPWSVVADWAHLSLPYPSGRVAPAFRKIISKFQTDSEVIRPHGPMEWDPDSCTSAPLWLTESETPPMFYIRAFHDSIKHKPKNIVGLVRQSISDLHTFGCTFRGWVTEIIASESKIRSSTFRDSCTCVTNPWGTHHP